MSDLRVFYILFNGWYPVGACALITARSVDHARELFLKELPSKLREMNPDLADEDFELWCVAAHDAVPRCEIILDGNY